MLELLPIIVVGGVAAIVGFYAAWRERRDSHGGK
jgi:hypothetical protein